MQSEINISIIIAVYQRQDELQELLYSLENQTDKEFEVVVVDDGSPEKLENIVQEFSDLNLKYFYKTNSGPGKSRNFGMEKASGNYFIFLDSDTIAPENYMAEVKKELTENYVDFFGGADSAAEDFSPLQKAINFSMTSFFTTGGIRGKEKAVTKFQPRSFNMGISCEAYEKSGGFGNLRIGEDPDLTMTLWELGFESRFIPKAKVFHKRRSTLEKFAKQVQQFGIARPILNQRHPKYNSITFWFPTLFLLGWILALLLLLFNFPYLIYLFGIYFLLIFIVSTFENKSMQVGFLSMITTFVQFVNYGFGFLKSQFYLNILNKNPAEIFPNHFYRES